jgi:hypothetical protein
MNFDIVIVMKQKNDFLLNNADPSIILRVKREVLGFLSEKKNCWVE